MLTDEQVKELERCLRAAGDEGPQPVVVSGPLMRALGSAHDDAVRLREAMEDLYAYSASCSMERIREGLEAALRPAGQGGG